MPLQRCSLSSGLTTGTKAEARGREPTRKIGKMLAVFENSIGKPPPELRILTDSPESVRTRAEMAAMFGSWRPDSTSYHLPSGNFMALSHANESPEHPRTIVVMDDVFCAFIGNIENISDLRRHYGLSRHATEAMLLVEVFRVLRDRAPYPPDQVIKDISGKFAFVLFDSKHHTLFIARDREGSVNLQWGMAGDDSLVCSDDPNIMSAACGRSHTSFPPGCIFLSGSGLVSFVHPMHKVRAIKREDDDGNVRGVLFQVDLFSRLPSIPRVGSATSWADATVVQGD